MGRRGALEQERAGVLQRAGCRARRPRHEVTLSAVPARHARARPTWPASAPPSCAACSPRSPASTASTAR
jgi:hypothetical protein